MKKACNLIAIAIAIAGLLLSAESAVARAAKNEVWLIETGYVQQIKGRELIPGVRDDGARRVASTMALVKGEGAIVFVDPGFIGDRSRIFRALKAAGVDAAKVTHVFMSHHHPDHTLNAALFPNATAVDFWASYRNDLWSDHGNNWEIAPGIEVVRTPGHTNEDASLVVDTAEGKVVFSHVWWNENRFPAADPLGHDQGTLEASRALVLKLADCIVPGHGRPFPNPNKAKSRCAVRDAQPR